MIWKRTTRIYEQTQEECSYKYHCAGTVRYRRSVFTVVMFDTRKSIFIVIPILVALPLAKQLVAYIMCAGFRELSDEEYSKLKKLSYFEDPSVVYDVSVSRYEGIVYFPVAVIRDGRMLFYYNGDFGKKIKDEASLKR